MTNEEWNRKTEFLLNQQAKFDAGMQELKEAQKVSEEKLARCSEKAEQALDAVSQLADLTNQAITTMTNGFRSGFDRIKGTEEKIDVLVNNQIRTDEKIAALMNSQARTDDKIDALVNSQKLTEESLRATNESLRATDETLRDLTALFDRHIRVDHSPSSA